MASFSMTCLVLLAQLTLVPATMAQIIPGYLRKLDGVDNRKPAGNGVHGHLQDDGVLSPNCAAFHRDSKPDGALFVFTQHLLKSIKGGMAKCTGLLESSRHNFNVAMEFAFDLSDKLVNFQRINIVVKTTFYTLSKIS